MREITLTDMTMRELDNRQNVCLSFREKLELAKLLDQLDVPVIEISLTEGGMADRLLVKSVCSAVKNSTVAVNVGLDASQINEIWNAMSEARHPRLQLVIPVSSVQMEYLSGKKSGAMLQSVHDIISKCRELCGDVELIADDATRAEPEFMYEILKTAIDAGASVVTIGDSAGVLLPDTLSSFFSSLQENVPEVSNVKLGFSCSNELAMADSCAIASIRCGVTEVKCISYGYSTVRLETMARVLEAKAYELDAGCSIRQTVLKHTMDKINSLCDSGIRTVESRDDDDLPESTDIYLTEDDDMPSVLRTMFELGYDIAEEDRESVYEAFLAIAAKKDRIGPREIDAIIASSTMQVPPTYTLESYVINTGNTISATAHIRLKKDETVRDGMGLGDGPIDAAFASIENITGHHYELDDFQISAVTEEREAMGEAIIQLRSGARLCTGYGISTDIIGASIKAYLSALNKIAYEEMMENSSYDMKEERI